MLARRNASPPQRCFGGVPENLNAVWVACHFQKRLGRKDIQDADIQNAVHVIINFSADPTVSLRVSAGLLLGLAHIYWRKIDYFWQDCQTVLDRFGHFNASDSEQQRDTRKRAKARAVDRAARPSEAAALSSALALVDDLDSVLEEEEMADADLTQRLMERLEAAAPTPPPPARLAGSRRRAAAPRGLADLLGMAAAAAPLPALPAVAEETAMVDDEDEHIMAAAAQAAQNAVERWSGYADAGSDEDAMLLADLGVQVEPVVAAAGLPRTPAAEDRTPLSATPEVDPVLREEQLAELAPAQMVDLLTAAGPVRASVEEEEAEEDQAPSTADLNSSAARSLLEGNSPRLDAAAAPMCSSFADGLPGIGGGGISASSSPVRLSLLSLSTPPPPSAAAAASRRVERQLSVAELVTRQADTLPLQDVARRQRLFLINEALPGVTSGLDLESILGPAQTAQLMVSAASQTVSSEACRASPPSRRKRRRSVSSSELSPLQAAIAANWDLRQSGTEQRFVSASLLLGRLATAASRHLRKHVSAKAAAESRWAGVLAAAQQQQQQQICTAANARKKRHPEKDAVIYLSTEDEEDESTVEAVPSTALTFCSGDADGLLDEPLQLPSAAEPPAEAAAPTFALTPLPLPAESPAPAATPLPQSDAREVFSIVRGSCEERPPPLSSGRTPFKTPLRSECASSQEYELPSLDSTIHGGGLQVQEVTPIRPPGAGGKTPLKYTRGKRTVIPLGLFLRDDSAWRILKKETDFSMRTIKLMECLSARLSRPSAPCVPSAQFSRTQRPGTASTTVPDEDDHEGSRRSRATPAPGDLEEEEEEEDSEVPVVSFRSLVESQPSDVTAGIFFELLTLRCRQFVDFARVGEGAVLGVDSDLLITANHRYAQLTSTLSASRSSPQ